MLEEEIDNVNPKMIRIGGAILKNFFVSGQERVKWCKKWKDDKRKEIVVLQLLHEILTDLINYQPSPVRDDAVTLVKEFAEKRGLDYNAETKGINFRKDSHGGTEYKETTIKALHVINRILSPPKKIDAAVLKKNLKNYPYLSKAIGTEWLVRSSKSKFPHLLAYIYCEEPDHNGMKKLAKKLKSEKDDKKIQGIAWQYDLLAHTARNQSYWEQVFKTLDDCNLKISLSKLRDPSNAESILAEAEVLARLAPYFKVEPEPDIEELRPKKLDAKIEFNGQQALIEVAVVAEKIELEVAHGGISIPGEKVKNVLLDKFEKQLKAGKVNPKIPVVIILCLKNLDDYEVKNAVYGELKLQLTTRKDTQQIVEKCVIRDNNSFYAKKNSDIVTAIAAYNGNYTGKNLLVGKLYGPPCQIVPRNPLSREFRKKLRNALFGDSENSL